MSWITLSQKEEIVPRDAPDSPLYAVTFRVVAAGDIPLEIFVLDVATDSFQHVAFVMDLTAWPDSREAALDAYKAYYRAQSFTRTFDNKSLASAFSASVRARVDLLNQLWAADSSTAFGGELAFVYNSETSA